MKTSMSGEKPLTPAQREANKAFKPTAVSRPDAAPQEQSAFNKNRERLKAERLARESAKLKSK